jgi:hypothetical protein
MKKPSLRERLDDLLSEYPNEKLSQFVKLQLAVFDAAKKVRKEGLKMVRILAKKT